MAEEIREETEFTGDGFPEEASEETVKNVTGRIEQGFFSYRNVSEAEAALTEQARIRRLEKQLDLNRPKLVLALYTKAVNENIFTTAEGYAWLLKIRQYLEERRAFLDGDIPGIPAEYRADRDKERQIDSLRGTLQTVREHNLKLKRRTVSQMIVIVMLAIGLIAMLVIAGVSDSPNILNYERTLQDRYAGWETELKEREAAIRERELELKRQ